MAYHFAKLTLSNGKPVYVNGNLVTAVVQSIDQDTLVRFAGDEGIYIHVKESAEKVADILYDAMRE